MRQSFAKACCLMGALAGGVALSQYPAFVQQYTQRLAGQVDALTEVVADFDRSALAAGLTRPQALAEMSGTAFLEARAADMRSTFTRHTILTDQLSRLRAAVGMDLIMLAPQMRDAETLRATWGDFRPSVQLTSAGILTAGGGFAGGWLLVSLLLALLARPFRRPVQRPAANTRIDPPIRRPDGETPLHRPRLMGETRL